MIRIGIIILVLALLMSGCSKNANQQNHSTQEQASMTDFSEYAKVKVTKAGKIYLNGKEAGLEQLRHEFARLKQANGAVLYYREDPQGEPPAEAMEVIQAIINAKLPVSLVEKDFE
jgi:biopolymer transport protein ExbD